MNAGEDAPVGSIDKEREHKLLNVLPIGLLLRGKSGHYVDVNDRALEILELPREELLGTPINHLIERLHMTLPDGSPMRPETHPSTLVVTSGVGVVESEVGIVTPSGRHKRLTLSAVPVPGYRDDVAAAIALSDVTMEREATERLQEVAKMEALGHLAGGVAHDMNNLLTVILAHTQFAVEGVPQGPVADDLTQVMDAAEHGRDLMRQLLSFARPNPTGGETIDVGSGVHQLEQLVRRVLPANVELDVSAENGITVPLSSGHLQQILMNLVINARDALDPGGGRISIRVQRTDIGVEATHELNPGPHAVVEIEDDGPGISQSVQRRMFEPFFTTKDRGRGTGLGLATVFAVVKQARGHITVESDVGKGTRFSIYLPIAENAAASSTEEMRVEAPRVLVVDDDHAVRKVTERMLRNSGWEVVSCPSPEEALEVLETGPGRFDLLLSDLIMPNMSGVELAERARELNPALAVTFMSGYSDSHIQRFNAHQLSGFFLQKPFSADELNETMKACLAGTIPPSREKVAAATRILLIDDTADVGDLVSMALTYDNGELELVAHAPNGITGLERAEELRPDLILLDLELPDIRGFELLPRLRDLVPGARIVTLSGLPNVGDDLARSAGADAHYAKDRGLTRLPRFIHDLLRDESTPPS